MDSKQEVTVQEEEESKNDTPGGHTHPECIKVSAARSTGQNRRPQRNREKQGVVHGSSSTHGNSYNRHRARDGAVWKQPFFWQETGGDKKEQRKTFFKSKHAEQKMILRENGKNGKQKG